MGEKGSIPTIRVSGQAKHGAEVEQTIAFDNRLERSLNCDYLLAARLEEKKDAD